VAQFEFRVSVTPGVIPKAGALRSAHFSRLRDLTLRSFRALEIPLFAGKAAPLGMTPLRTVMKFKAKRLPEIVASVILCGVCG